MILKQGAAMALSALAGISLAFVTTRCDRRDPDAGAGAAEHGTSGQASSGHDAKEVPSIAELLAIYRAAESPLVRIGACERLLAEYGDGEAISKFATDQSLPNALRIDLLSLWARRGATEHGIQFLVDHLSTTLSGLGPDLRFVVRVAGLIHAALRSDDDCDGIADLLRETPGGTEEKVGVLASSLIEVCDTQGAWDRMDRFLAMCLRSDEEIVNQFGMECVMLARGRCPAALAIAIGIGSQPQWAPGDFETLLRDIAVAKDDRLSPHLETVISMTTGENRAWANEVLISWADEHPAEAVRWSIENSPAERASFTRAALSLPAGAEMLVRHVTEEGNLGRLGSQDLKLALGTLTRHGRDVTGTFAALPEDQRDLQFAHHLWDIASDDPKGALAFVEFAPDLNSAPAALPLLTSLFSEYPEAASTFLEGIPENARAQFALDGMTALVGNGQTGAALALADRILAGEVSSEIPPESVFQFLSVGFTSSGLGTQELVDWLQTLPPEIRETGDRKLLEIIAERDPESVIPWVESADAGAVRDEVAAKLIQTIPSSHGSFGALLELIGDEEIRGRALEAVGERPAFEFQLQPLP